MVYLYLTRAIQGFRGRIKAAFDAIHRAAVRNGFADLYLVADQLAFHSIDYDRLKVVRAGAATAFRPGHGAGAGARGQRRRAPGPPLGGQARRPLLYRGALSQLPAAGLDMAHVAERTAFDRRCAETATTSTGYTSIGWTYSFNEWAEGSGLEELEPRSARYPFGFVLQPLQILFQKLP